MAYISKAELAEGQKLPWIGVCPVFPGADWEPRENSKHRVRLQKASPDTEVPRPVWWALLWKWRSKLWPRPGPTWKTLSRLIPQSVSMDLIPEVR